MKFNIFNIAKKIALALGIWSLPLLAMINRPCNCPGWKKLPDYCENALYIQNLLPESLWIIYESNSGIAMLIAAVGAILLAAFGKFYFSLISMILTFLLFASGGFCLN